MEKLINIIGGWFVDSRGNFDFYEYIKLMQVFFVSYLTLFGLHSIFGKE